MFSKLKIVEIYYNDEEEMNDKIAEELGQFQLLYAPEGTSAKVKQILEQGSKYFDQLGQTDYIKLVFEIS